MRNLFCGIAVISGWLAGQFAWYKITGNSDYWAGIVGGIVAGLTFLFAVETHEQQEDV